MLTSEQSSPYQLSWVWVAVEVPSTKYQVPSTFIR